MRILTALRRRRPFGLVAAATLLFFAASLMPISAAYADPPPWAPAHGWRAFRIEN